MPSCKSFRVQGSCASECHSTGDLAQSLKCHCWHTERVSGFMAAEQNLSRTWLSSKAGLRSARSLVLLSYGDHARGLPVQAKLTSCI